MSLSTVIADPLVRRKLDEFVPDVSRGLEAAMLVPPRSEDPRIIGGAFDYALRMKLEHTFSHVRRGPWVADKSAAHLYSQYAFPGTGTASGYWWPYAKKALEIVHAARQFMESPKSKSPNPQDEEFAMHGLRLARLDQVYRAGYTDGKFDTVSQEQLAEVVALLKIAPIERFRHRQTICNPDLDLTGTVVGGADADLLVGTRLIEIKTVNRRTVDVAWIRQLLGYLVLARNPQAVRVKPIPIRRLEVYFSRHAAFWSIDAEAIVRQRGFRTFERWFIKNGRSALQRALKRRWSR